MTSRIADLVRVTADPDTRNRAADEIERLTAENRRMKSAIRKAGARMPRRIRAQREPREDYMAVIILTR